MKLYQIGLLAAGIVLGGAALQAAEKSSVDELAKELRGETPAAGRTPEQLQAVYAQVLDSLMPNLSSEDPKSRADGQGKIERIAFHAGRPGAETERVACSKAIAARLGPEVGSLGRVWLLRQLERIGSAEAAPSLAGVLADKDPLVRESARRALQKNPSQEANAAIGQALGSADAPAWRVALINALAERRDPSNLGLLLREAAAENEDVHTAALIALANLGDASAQGPIAAAMGKGTPRGKAIAADCYFRLAGALAARGEKAAALDLYKKMLAAEGHLKCAAIVGIGRSGGAADLPTLLDAAASQDAKVRGAGVEALSVLEGAEVTAAIAAKVETAGRETKVALLRALVQRGDKGSASTFMTAAGDADEAVQTAALAGLATVGNPAAVPLLLKAAATSGMPQEAARQSLQSLPGADVDKALQDALGQQDPKVRVEAIRALAGRHAVAATPSLLKAAGDPDAGVRNESVKALGVVGPSGALPALAAVLVKTEDGPFRVETANAMVRIASRDPAPENCSEAVLKAMAGCGGPAKISLLGVLGRIGGPKSLEGVRDALKDNDEQVRGAAFTALTEWPDAAAAADLLAIAKTAAGETRHVQALRGYLRVCGIQAERPAAETAALLAAGLAVARRPDEKKMALGELGKVRDIAALEAAVSCLSDSALTEEAACAAAHVARDLWQGHPEAVKTAMRKVLEVSKNAQFRREAQEALDRAEQKPKAAKRK